MIIFDSVMASHVLHVDGLDSILTFNKKNIVLYSLSNVITKNAYSFRKLLIEFEVEVNEKVYKCSI
jgi:metal-dependent hydrolase (beta-lactamase superfamily II)